MLRLLLVLVFCLSGCSWKQDPHTPIGSDVQSDKVIEALGIQVQYGKITARIYSDDLRAEIKPDGSVWARLIEEPK